MQALDRDILNVDELQRDKVWINYKILENYVNEVYTKYQSFTQIGHQRHDVQQRTAGDRQVRAHQR